MALINAWYPETNPFLYLFGVLFVIGLLAIVGAAIGLIANGSSANN